MAIYALNEVVPTIDPQAFVHPDAVIIGDVVIGPESTIWPGAVLRGDYGNITIGERTSIQDGSVLHAGPGLPTTIGNGCVVGHLVHLEGCKVHDGALIGSASVVLHLAVVEAGATIAANAVVPNGMVVPAGALARGVPAKITEGASHIKMIRLSANEYVANGHRYRKELRRLD